MTSPDPHLYKNKKKKNLKKWWAKANMQIMLSHVVHII